MPDAPVQIIANASGSAPSAPVQIAANESGSTPSAPPTVVGGAADSIPASFAVGSFVFDTPAADGDTAVIGGVTYTFRNTPAGTNQIGIITSETPTAAEHALALSEAMAVQSLYILNVHPTVSPVGVVGSTVNLRAKTGGVAGNAITLAETGSSMTRSGATLSGGVEATGPETPTPITGNGEVTTPAAPVQITANGSGSTPTAPPVVVA